MVDDGDDLQDVLVSRVPPRRDRPIKEGGIVILAEAHQYMRDRLNELRVWCSSGSAWVFLCATSYLEYLAKLDKGDTTTAQDYKAFIRKWMPKYAVFEYKSGRSDLPDQMYHVLRSGLVHSFSLIPDKMAKKKGGRNRSVVLAHRAEGKPHLSQYVTRRIRDGVLFVVEDFVEDLDTVTNAIFNTASTDTKLASNIKRWLKKHPPLTGGF